MRERDRSGAERRSGKTTGSEAFSRTTRDERRQTNGKISTILIKKLRYGFLWFNNVVGSYRSTDLAYYWLFVFLLFKYDPLKYLIIIFSYNYEFYLPFKLLFLATKHFCKINFIKCT